MTAERAVEEDGDEHHQNPFITQPSTSKIQLRNQVSRACWDESVGMGEVVERKGSMWVTTGIVRSGRLYCHIEEMTFLAERGALLLSSPDGTSLSLKDVYTKIAEGMGESSWEFFEVYKHLKLLGYVVGRHGIPWTMKNDLSCCNSKFPQCPYANDVNSEVVKDETETIIRQFQDVQINELKPTFDVYLPNSKFRKSAPGDPSFLLCIVRGKPPSRVEVESLEKNCNGIPLKFCFVDHGRVNVSTVRKKAKNSVLVVLAVHNGETVEYLKTTLNTCQVI